MGGVQDGVGNYQASDRAATDNVGLNNFIHVLRSDAAVPNRFGIHNDSWAKLTLIKTTGFIGAHHLNAALREFGFEEALKFSLSGGIAAAAWMAGFALIQANKNMLLEFWHNGILTYRRAACVQTAVVEKII